MNTESESVATAPNTTANEKSALYLGGFIKITDPDSEEIILEQRDQ